MKQLSKRTIKILIALGLLAAAVTGLTLAYYSSQKEFENEFRVKEPGAAVYEKFNPADKWVPGEEKSKEVWFKNTGEMDMLLRFSVEVEWETDNAEAATPPDRPAKDVVDLYWKNSQNGEVPFPMTPEEMHDEENAYSSFDFTPITQDGVTYYYYNKVLKAKDTVDGDGNDLSKTQNVLESVKFHTDLSNDGHHNSDYSGTQINLTIKGETVLADEEAVKNQWDETPGIQVEIDGEAGTVRWSSAAD